jgi:hypothetical protein
MNAHLVVIGNLHTSSCAVNAASAPCMYFCVHFILTVNTKDCARKNPSNRYFRVPVKQSSSKMQLEAASFAGASGDKP